MRVAIAQINTTIGDFKGNSRKILDAYQRGIESKADLVVVPELALTGYPPRDLLLNPQFVKQNLQHIKAVASQVKNTGLIIGYVAQSGKSPGRPLANAAALLHQGRELATQHKTLLPSYDVFDEDRYFEAATENVPVEFLGKKIGLTICEDAWNDERFWFDRRYRQNPIAQLLKAPCDLIVNISASPWQLEKQRLRLDMFQTQFHKSNTPLIYCNAVGGNDELLFDGTSFALDKNGKLILQCASFSEDFQIIDLESSPPIAFSESHDEQKLCDALVMGIGDYLKKCGFHSAIIGLSGGIDSAITAALAVKALGKDHVFGIAMPSQYSSQESIDDAKILANNLKIRCEVISIQKAFDVFRQSLTQICSPLKGMTEENIQARLRGVFLMSLSNQFGSLLLTTGNKSELAVGYCTLYGDMCGGLAAISDVPKTMIYKLARWLNRKGEIIPTRSIEKPPSAELRPNQKDEDSLPPYEILDAILHAYVVELKSGKEIIERGFSEEDVSKVISLIERNEYKRRQAAPGLKITSKAFGLGRRVPIAQHHKVL